jgi:toxin ParE1/3/4
MLPYVLTADAEQDLLEVARYTLVHWGSDMLKQYRDGLKEAFHAIATKALPGRSFSSTFPHLLVAKYRYHYIFYIHGASPKPVIIGIIHERRDIVTRLKERLG